MSYLRLPLLEAAGVVQELIKAVHGRPEPDALAPKAIE